MKRGNGEWARAAVGIKTAGGLWVYLDVNEDAQKLLWRDEGVMWRRVDNEET